MSERGNAEFLNDICESIRRIVTYTNGMDYEAFLSDTKTQDAVVRNLEVLGEAAKNISGALKVKYPKLPWKDLAGVRDKLIHHYFGVNLEIVWCIVTDDLPPLKDEIKLILESGKNINPKFGVEGVKELIEDYETLKKG